MVKTPGPLQYQLSRWSPHLWHLLYRRHADGALIEVFVRTRRDALAELDAAGITHVEPLQ